MDHIILRLSQQIYSCIGSSESENQLEFI